MQLEKAEVVAHSDFGGGYRLLVLRTAEVAMRVRPGQFVHVRIPRLDAAVLRRPFSVFRVQGDTLSVLYKPVGHGTRTMVEVPAGATVSVLGPLGNGFPTDHADTLPVLVAGGYGVAPLCLLAQRLPRRGVVFIGGATARDVLCVSDFEGLGWQVEVSTNDGSLGACGLVIELMDGWLAAEAGKTTPEFYACGPDGMLKAVGARAIAHGFTAWLSLDKHMGCGVGACLACVQRVRRDGVEKWARVCKDGPIFEAREIVWS